MFYGRNGAGKSNILAAMEVLFDLLAWRSVPGSLFSKLDEPIGTVDFLDWADACHFVRVPGAILGARLQPGERDWASGWPWNEELTIEIQIDWSRGAIGFTCLEAGGRYLLPIT